MLRYLHTYFLNQYVNARLQLNIHCPVRSEPVKGAMINFFSVRPDDCMDAGGRAMHGAIAEPVEGGYIIVLAITALSSCAPSVCSLKTTKTKYFVAQAIFF